MRRAIAASAAAAVVVLGAALPAWAAGPSEVRSPYVNSTIDTSVPVVVRVQENCYPFGNDVAGGVEAVLSGDGTEPYPGSQPVALERTKTCANDSEYSEWGGATIDPASPTAFFGSGAAPMCNGRWHVRARADDGAWTGVWFTVSRSPAAPTGVTTTVDGDDVRVSWSPNPEPDLVGYRVERRRAGSSSWSAVGTGTGTSRTDSGVTPGDWEYRVVALRGDGSGGVAPCADTTADLSRASAVRTATVREPEPVSSPSPGASPGPGTGGDATGGTDDGSASDGDTATDGDASDGGGSDGDAAGGGTSDGDAAATDGGEADGGTDDGAEAGTSDGDSTSGTSRRVGAPPPAVRTGPELAAPDLPAVAAPQAEERYYGEDDEYDPALDFGSIDGVEGSETRSRSTTSLSTRVVPQAVQEFVSRYVDPDRVLKPIAAGLVLVAFALHLRRWTREHDVAGR